MGIKMDTKCLLCHLQRNIETARKLGDEETATAFARDMVKNFLEAPKDASSPTLSPKTAELYQKYYGLSPNRFQKEKDESNKFVLERLDQIEARVCRADDPILAGLQYAILGNYIDFSALHGKVSFSQLEEMLRQAEKIQVDAENLQSLRQDLKIGKKLLYITDNAGEICFDRVFAQQIAKKYPQLEITFCVRGGPAQNDATREDAKLAGIPFPVIDNGNTVPGTVPELLSPQALQALREADVIISKGQGNIETLFDCGYNVYYAFLIKCEKFQELFGKAQFTPMLVRDRQAKDILK